MKQFILKNKNALMGIGAAILLGGITMSFQESPLLRQKFELQKSLEDTLPEKDNEAWIKMTDGDKLTQDLNKTLTKVGVEMKKIDFSFVQKKVNNAINEIDLQKILKETQLSLKSIDFDKILTEVRATLKDIVCNEKKGEMEKAIKDALEKTKLIIKKMDID